MKYMKSLRKKPVLDSINNTPKPKHDFYPIGKPISDKKVEQKDDKNLMVNYNKVY